MVPAVINLLRDEEEAIARTAAMVITNLSTDQQCQIWIAKQGEPATLALALLYIYPIYPSQIKTLDYDFYHQHTCVSVIRNYHLHTLIV